MMVGATCCERDIERIDIDAREYGGNFQVGVGDWSENSNACVRVFRLVSSPS